jgi:beta-lactam-binding protein with PASTA domain
VIFGPVLGPILVPLLKALGVKLAQEAQESIEKLAKGKVVSGGVEAGTETDAEGRVVKTLKVEDSPENRPPL